MLDALLVGHGRLGPLGVLLAKRRRIDRLSRSRETRARLTTIASTVGAQPSRHCDSIDPQLAEITRTLPAGPFAGPRAVCAPSGRCDGVAHATAPNRETAARDLWFMSFLKNGDRCSRWSS